MLNHYWDFDETTSLNTNIAYQFGTRGDSRLGYDNAPNPDPTYYQKLPSFFLGDPNGPNYDQAEAATINFQEDGQIDWNRMYFTNMSYVGSYRYYFYVEIIVFMLLFANAIYYIRIYHITQYIAAI